MAGEEVHASDMLAKIPRETTKTKDVVELFGARKPKEPAVISELGEKELQPTW